MGHYGPFVTHDLTLKDGEMEVDAPMDLTEFGAYCAAWQVYQRGEVDAWDVGDIRMTRREAIRSRGQQRNPLLNVSVDPGIIRDHNDIWGDRFGEFLYRFVAVQSARLDRPCPSGDGK